METQETTGAIEGVLVEEFDPFADEELQKGKSPFPRNDETKEVKRRERATKMATAVERAENSVSGQMEIRDRRRISEIVPDVPVFKCEDIQDQEIWIHHIERRTGKYGEFLVTSIEFDAPEEGQEPGILLIGGTVLQAKIQKLWDEINKGHASFPVLCQISKKSGAEFDYWGIS